MPPGNAPAASAMAGAAARTAAAGTARLLAAWCTGSPLPEAADRRCEGVADLAARRARVTQSLFFTDRLTAALTEAGDGTSGFLEGIEHSEMIYDGANAYVRVAGSWTGFFLADPGGPRGPNDPLWPLDALFGASDDAAEVGPQAVRGVPATRYRLTVDLARADAAAAARSWSIVELWDFGVAAVITPPGPGEILAPAEAYRLAEEEPPARGA
jgi:hypothetical protein